MDMTGFVRKTKKVTYGDRELTFAELKLVDWVLLKQHVQVIRDEQQAKKRKQLIEMAKEIGDIDSMKLLEYVDQPVTEDELDEMVSTLDGMGFMVYRSLKYAHPDITLEQAQTIADTDTVVMVTEIMFGKKKAQVIAAAQPETPA